MILRGAKLKSMFVRQLSYLPEILYYICNMEKSFRFDHVLLKPKQQIGLHEHREWEISLIIKGCGIRTMGDTDAPFSQGDIVLIPPGMPHCWRFSDDDYEIENMTIVFPQSVIDAASAALPELRQAFGKLSNITMACTFSGDTRRHLTEHISAMGNQTDAMHAVSLLQILATVAENQNVCIAGKRQYETNAERRLKQIRIFVTCNNMHKVTIDDIALHTGMNRSSLCTFFRRHTGMTLIEYVNRMRLDNAKRLLCNQSLTVQQVCYRSGFQDVPYFCRLFKRTFGMTPSEYRHR